MCVSTTGTMEDNMNLPQNNHELLSELDMYINDLPIPVNALFMLELYKMFINHKIEHVAQSIVLDFAAKQTNADE